MSNIIVNQVIPDVLYIVLSVALSFIVYYVKRFFNSHKDLIEKQKEALQQTMGIEQYNADKAKAIEIINAVEQMGKEFDWQGEIKHSKATEMISQKTGLSAEDIFNIIKGTVGEFNKSKGVSN